MYLGFDRHFMDKDSGEYGYNTLYILFTLYTLYEYNVYI